MSIVKKSLASVTAFFDFFIHSSLKNELEKLEKSRMLVVILCSFLMMNIIYTGFFIYNGIIFELKAFYNYIGIAVMALSLYLIKIKGELNRALEILCLLGFVLITVSVSLAGGIYSNDLYWYLVISVSAMVFISLRLGLVFFLLAVAILIVLYLLETLSLIDFAKDTLSMGLEYKLINLIFIFSLMISIMFVLIKGNSKLQNIIRLKKEQEVRETIARDFHDQIGNKLAAIRHLSKLNLANKSAEEQKQVLHKIETNSKEVYDNFKDFIWTKNPESDYFNELFMYLRDYADDFLAHSDLVLRIETEPSPLPSVKMKPLWSRELTPMFKEAITNSYKYSNGTELTLAFKVTMHEIEISISDNGTGFDLSDKKSGKGIRNMIHRAQSIGGDLQIESVIEKGTKITFKGAILPD